MKISASLYANEQARLDHLVKELDRYEVDYFHLDCRDRPEVFADIAHIRSLSDTPIDLHLISENPDQYVSAIERASVELITYQFESLRSPSQLPEAWISQQGLAIVSGTPIEVFDAFQDRCSFVLFMTTTPGESGGVFGKENFQRIRAFRKRYPGVRVHVDGGVNHEVSFILRHMGVSLIVSGSYLVNASTMGLSMLKLKTEATHSQYRIADFMIGQEDTPRLNAANANFLDVLQHIEQYGLGLTTIVDSQGHLQGIVTNADVRRALLRHAADLNQIPFESLLNRKPVFVYVDQTLTELMQTVKRTSFPVNYLPVLDRKRRVTGMVTFADLIKGEW